MREITADAVTNRFGSRTNTLIADSGERVVAVIVARVRVASTMSVGWKWFSTFRPRVELYDALKKAK